MTSKENDLETKVFFKTNKYFEYGEENIIFFTQGQIPMVDENGRVLLKSKHEILEASDGNGGIFEAIRKNKLIEDFEKRNIEWICISGVDNVLINFADSLQIGLTIEKSKEFSSKSVLKLNSKEKVGVFCKKNTRPGVIEYTELPESLRELTNKDGELVYGESNIVCHLFKINAIKEIVNAKLPYHVAYKSCTYLNNNGEVIISRTPNAYKFETFIFDAFSMIEDMLLLRVKREDEFAPVKNADGADSPETARKLYTKNEKSPQSAKIDSSLE